MSRSQAPTGGKKRTRRQVQAIRIRPPTFQVQPEPDLLVEAIELCEEGTLSVNEGCAFTGWGRTEMYARMRRGEIPYIQDGRRRLIPRRGLVLYLARCLLDGER